MTDIGPIELCESLDRLFSETCGDERLKSEIARAEREFFGSAEQMDRGRIGEAAQRRFIEWYLLERYSEVLGGVPALILSAAQDNALASGFENSVVGVFLVEAVTDGEVQLRDLQEGWAIDMMVPEGLKARSGDLLVGRLFPDVATAATPSVVLALLPSEAEFAQALQRDLANPNLERRLTQAELEQLLFRDKAAPLEAMVPHPPLEHLEADLERYIQAARRSNWQATEISAALRESSRPGEVMEPLLDEIAFETKVDIEQLRTLLMQIWNAYRAEDVPVDAAPVAPPSVSSCDAPEEPLGETLARRIEEGIERQEDMEKVFSELEQTLGMEAEEEVPRMPEAGEDGIPPFEGDLQPLVGEYLWEERCGEGPEAATLNALVAQQRELPLPRMNLESLEASDLLRFLLAAYLASPPDRRREEVRTRFGILSSFYEWAERSQLYELNSILKACEEVFVTELERLHHASHELSEATAPDPGATPSLVRVAEVGAEGVMVMPAGADPELLVQPEGSRAELRSGDLILGMIERTEAAEIRIRGFVLVLPESAQDLMG